MLDFIVISNKIQIQRGIIHVRFFHIEPCSVCDKISALVLMIVYCSPNHALSIAILSVRGM